MFDKDVSLPYLVLNLDRGHWHWDITTFLLCSKIRWFPLTCD